MELIYFGDYGPSALPGCAHGGGIANIVMYAMVLYLDI